VLDPQIYVGIDVGCKVHRVGISGPDGSILEEFDISHTDADFQDFFRRGEAHKEKLALPVAVAMDGRAGGKVKDCSASVKHFWVWEDVDCRASGGDWNAGPV